MLTQDDLDQFTGTEHYYKHSLNRLVLYTDGIQYVAKKGQAYWLIDAIASYQTKKFLEANPFQLWELVKTGSQAVLTCKEDSGEPNLVEQKIEFTDFPLDKIKVYVEVSSLDGVNEVGVILLPSEH